MCLSDLDPATGADIIDRLPQSIAARLLAGLHQNQRRRLLEALPAARRHSLQHALRYPEDSIGTIMLPDTPCCRSDASVRDAKRLVRRYRSEITPCLTVLDNAQRPVGLVDVGQLLRLRERDVLSEHMQSVQVRLRARARIETVVNHRAWTTADYLPVVDSDDSFAGLLAKAAVYGYALDQDPTRRTEGRASETLVALADLIWRPGAAILARTTTPEQREPD
jgi:magnesium transporter